MVYTPIYRYIHWERSLISGLIYAEATCRRVLVRISTRTPTIQQALLGAVQTDPEERASAPLPGDVYVVRLHGTGTVILTAVGGSVAIHLCIQKSPAFASRAVERNHLST